MKNKQDEALAPAADAVTVDDLIAGRPLTVALAASEGDGATVDLFSTTAPADVDDLILTSEAPPVADAAVVAVAAAVAFVVDGVVVVVVVVVDVAVVAAVAVAAVADVRSRNLLARLTMSRRSFSGMSAGFGSSK